MIYQIIDLPPNIIGFKASWALTQNDFEEVVVPCVQKHVEKMGQINFMLELNGDVLDSTSRNWLNNVLPLIRETTNWNRVAIIADSDATLFSTQIFNLFIPGEFKVFSQEDAQYAIDWVSEADKHKIAV